MPNKEIDTMPKEEKDLLAELLGLLADYQPQCSGGDAPCITLKNSAKKELHIVLDNEFTVFYDVWHKHYCQDEFETLLQDVRRILHNERYIISIFLQDNWIGTILWDEPLTREVKTQIDWFLKEDKNQTQQAKTYDVEARIEYWDETKNQAVVFASGEY